MRLRQLVIETMARMTVKVAVVNTSGEVRENFSRSVNVWEAVELKVKGSCEAEGRCAATCAMYSCRLSGNSERRET